MMVPAKISAIGAYVPEKKLTNEDLQRMVDTSDEWIVQRTGIRERRVAAGDEFTSDMGVKAAQDLAFRYGKKLDDVDMVIVCTNTPDTPFPSAASQVQAKLGIPGAGALDLNAACAGFVYGLHAASAFVAAGLHRKVLVIGGDTMTKITDYTDRTTCILFGDGAGAALVEPDGVKQRFLSHYEHSDGSSGHHVYRTGLSSVCNGKHLHASGLVVQNGREVYRWAVTEVPQGMRKVADRANLALEAIDWFVPHSANLRMIESICEKSGFPIGKTLASVEPYGNTSAASIPLALDLAVRAGKIKSGDKVLLYGFGAGLAQAGLLVEWAC